ncbi:MAG: c-type cytochrome biogenesis protein CcsB [Dehalococcoidia bacterium]
MAKMEPFMFMAALISLGVSAVFYLWYATRMRRLARQGVVAGGEAAPGETLQAWEPGRFATMMAILGLVFLTLSMTFRWVATGHGPFSNMYEYSQAWSWGIVAALLYFQRRYRFKVLGALVVPVAVFFLLYAYSLPSRALPLVPALQQSLLLTIHVAVAMIAYGTFAIAFGTAVLYLFQRRDRVSWLPSSGLLDDLGYRAIIVGFPLMTLTIVLGALWADIAWGRYWGWDPKETASLVAWLIYGGYLHARLVAGWRGTRSSILLLVGFAAVLFTYFGNYFLGGLHSYA